MAVHFCLPKFDAGDKYEVDFLMKPRQQEEVDTTGLAVASGTGGEGAALPPCWSHMQLDKPRLWRLGAEAPSLPGWILSSFHLCTRPLFRRSWRTMQVTWLPVLHPYRQAAWSAATWLGSESGGPGRRTPMRR